MSALRLASATWVRQLPLRGPSDVQVSSRHREGPSTRNRLTKSSPWRQTAAPLPTECTVQVGTLGSGPQLRPFSLRPMRIGDFFYLLRDSTKVDIPAHETQCAPQDSAMPSSPHMPNNLQNMMPKDCLESMDRCDRGKSPLRTRAQVESCPRATLVSTQSLPSVD